MFYVDLISDKIWHQIVDNVINLELETLDISYVLISKKKNNNEVVQRKVKNMEGMQFLQTIT